MREIEKEGEIVEKGERKAETMRTCHTKKHTQGERERERKRERQRERKRECEKG